MKGANSALERVRLEIMALRAQLAFLLSRERRLSDMKKQRENSSKTEQENGF